MKTNIVMIRRNNNSNNSNCNKNNKDLLWCLLSLKNNPVSNNNNSNNNKFNSNWNNIDCLYKVWFLLRNWKTCLHFNLMIRTVEVNNRKKVPNPNCIIKAVYNFQPIKEMEIIKTLSTYPTYLTTLKPNKPVTN